MDDQQVITRIKSDLSWLQKHERLIVAVLLIALGLWLGNKYLNNSAAKDKIAATVAAQQLEEQKQINSQQEQRNGQTAAQYQAMVETLTRQNGQLAAAVTSRNASLNQRQQQNQTAPLPELAKEWGSLIGAVPGDLTATPSGIAADDSAARTTVNLLESVPVLQANLKDTQSIADNRQVELNKADELVSGLNTQITGLHTEIKDADKACSTEIASIKAEARKSKRNWFVGGVMAGAALVIHFGLGI